MTANTQGEINAELYRRISKVEEQVSYMMDGKPSIPTVDDLREEIRKNTISGYGIMDATLLPTENHALQLAAISDMMVVAQHVNEGWKRGPVNAFFCLIRDVADAIGIQVSHCQDYHVTGSNCLKSKEAAELAVKIMGAERMNHYFGIFND